MGAGRLAALSPNRTSLPTLTHPPPPTPHHQYPPQQTYIAAREAHLKPGGRMFPQARGGEGGRGPVSLPPAAAASPSFLPRGGAAASHACCRALSPCCTGQTPPTKPSKSHPKNSKKLQKTPKTPTKPHKNDPSGGPHPRRVLQRRGAARGAHRARRLLAAGRLLRPGPERARGAGDGRLLRAGAWGFWRVLGEEKGLMRVWTAAAGFGGLRGWLSEGWLFGNPPTHPPTHHPLHAAPPSFPPTPNPPSPTPPKIPPKSHHNPIITPNPPPAPQTPQKNQNPPKQSTGGGGRLRPLPAGHRLRQPAAGLWGAAGGGARARGGLSGRAEGGEDFWGG